jgi:hypothetical protein
MIVVEGPKSVHIAAAAWLVEENRELAWAQKHVVHNPAYAWVLGKYVGANKANDNGHIFDGAELAEARQSLVHAPMNMLHRPSDIMGVYVANEVIWPKDASASASLAGEAATETEPFLEALAAFYRYYFPEEYVAVEKAHRAGALAWSMECVPKTVTCAASAHPECGKTFDYAGRQSESYCAHLNEPGAPKRMGKPHFTAGALVLPPARPAWRNANVTSLDTLVRQELEAAESVYNQVATEFPHLESSRWEHLMAELLMRAAKDQPQRTVKSPHKYKPLNPAPNAPCALCGLGSQDKLHNVPGGDAKAAAEFGRDIAKEFSGEKRAKLAKEGKARDDGSFPIESIADLRNAIRAIGRAKNPAAAKAHIVRRAKALGATNLLPAGWK